MDDIRQRLEEFKASMEKPRPDAVTRAKPETELQKSFDEYRMAQQEARERLLSELPGRAVSGAIPGAVGALAGYAAQFPGIAGDMRDLYETYKPESAPNVPEILRSLPTTERLQKYYMPEDASPEMKAGMVGGNAFALAQGAAALPALVKGVAKGAPKLLGNLIDEILAPRSGPSSQRGAIHLNEKGGRYETRQEGPFYRVTPRAIESTGSGNSGISEKVRQADTSGGSSGSNVQKPISDEEIKLLIKDPSNFVSKVANTYTQEASGHEYSLPTMPESSLAKQSSIGRVFQLAANGDDNYKHVVFDAYGKLYPEIIKSTKAKNYDQLTEAAYLQLAKETSSQFHTLPIRTSYYKQGEGNYQNSGELLKDIYGNRHMYVYQGGDKHDFLNAIDPETSLNSNEMFRAIHDFYGHGVHGNSFGPKGEEIAYGAHSQMFSPLARMAMASETRGQNSFVNYTPINAELKQRINLLNEARYEASRQGKGADVEKINNVLKEAWKEFQFAPQKSVLLPPEFLDTAYAGGMPGYISPLIVPDPSTAVTTMLTHFSNSPDLTFLDPKFYGTGIKGSEMSRLRSSGNPVMERAYAYTGEPSLLRPEKGLGPHRYGAMVTDLYDLSTDPLSLNKLAKEANRVPFTSEANPGVIRSGQAQTDLERLIKEYGYSGMTNPDLGMAILYNKTPVNPFAKGGAVSQDVMNMAVMNQKVQHKQVGGVMKGVKALMNAAEEVKRLKAAIAPAYSSKIMDSTTARFIDKIAKENPKFTNEEVIKKATIQAKKKLDWERVNKPELEKRYGELAKSSYAESNPAKMQNTPEVVEERIRKANEFLNIPTESWVPPKKDLQAFDRSLIKDAVEGFPGVSQSSFPRDVPARASTEHVEELYSNPINRDLIERQIKRGLPLGGETFYASLYPVKQAALEAGVAPDKFEKWVHGLAPASARNSILNENAVGQFLRDMNARGIPLTEENVAVEMAKFKEKYGMGLPLMPIHRQGVANIVEGGMNLRDMSLANIPTNYKIPTYGTQKAGDFANSVVLDVHEAGGQSQGSRYHPYFNEQGGFGNTEYGAGEAGLMSIANDIGIPGGMAQAGRWLGGGELTGLRSPRGDALDILERQIAYTLKAQGKQPNPTMIRNELLNQIDTGEGILLPWYKKESIPDVREIGLQRKKGGVVQKKADGGLTSDDLVLEERML